MLVVVVLTGAGCAESQYDIDELIDIFNIHSTVFVKVVEIQIFSQRIINQIQNYIQQSIHVVHINMAIARDITIGTPDSDLACVGGDVIALNSENQCRFSGLKSNNLAKIMAANVAYRCLNHSRIGILHNKVTLNRCG